ncbi:MAG: TSUP family transporter, partial [Firmicutes bacterium]|nr:TSUP family transporter [Bacillota bacterium]
MQAAHAIIFLSVSGLLAGFIDSVVGGGGIIVVPALLSTGLSPFLTLGTNKMAGALATTVSAGTYWKRKTASRRLLWWIMPISFGSAALGASVVLTVNAHLLEVLIFSVTALVFVITLLRKSGAASV